MLHSVIKLIKDTIQDKINQNYWFTSSTDVPFISNHITNGLFLNLPVILIGKFGKSSRQHPEPFSKGPGKIGRAIEPKIIGDFCYGIAVLF